MRQESKRVLLRLARQAVEAVVRGQPTPEFASDEPELNIPAGAFVTLTTHGDLRGCIGRFTSHEPVHKTVVEMAQAAATEDPRFYDNPLRPDELGGLHVEISVLSPLRRIARPLDIELGVHGIYIRRGQASGCFLPQVATETGWTKEEFLGNCCAHKAGLPPDAWRDPDTEVQVFTAELMEEGPES